MDLIKLKGMYQNVTDTSNAGKLPIPQDAWMLHCFDKMEVVRLHLPPGASMDHHVNEWHIVFFVLRGAGSLNVEGKTQRLGEHQSIAVEAGKERSWANTGKEDLELLVMKTKEA